MKFMVTFGLKYRYNEHPLYFSADPEGWVTIKAPNEDKARRLAFAALGEHWAFMYDEDTFKPEHFPKGELMAIDYIAEGGRDAIL